MMGNLIQKALAAKRESKQIEFKRSFNSASPGDWCELIKDLVAIANSGGGIIVFGLDNVGVPTGESVRAIADIDPADIANKISKYTGPVDLEFDIHAIEKQKQVLVAFVIHPLSIPLVFQKPGTYDIGLGKQRNAFSVGTVYFRHGAKSEPGTSDDIRKVIDRQLDHIRKSWLKGVRNVVQTPRGSEIVTVNTLITKGTLQFSRGATVRVVKDPNATPVRLTRDPMIASGSFVHEELSDGIFDEINNVIDANQVLAKGQSRFFLGQPIYYRIYAERQHVQQNEDCIALLFHSAVSEFYAPFIFWSMSLPDKIVATALAELCLLPRGLQVHCLLRTSVLLGRDFSEWLFGKWESKWKRHPQPPSFYWSLKDILSNVRNVDPRALAARVSVTSQIQTENEQTIDVSTLLEKPDLASSILSAVCMRVFNGDNSLKSLARSLDYLAYGANIQKRSARLTKTVIKIAGNRSVVDVGETTEIG